MGFIPPDHDAAVVFIGRYMTDSGRSGKRAFSSGSRARRWAEHELDRNLDWEANSENNTWTASESRVRARVERVTLHDPPTLQRRYRDAFEGEYSPGDQ